MMMSEILLSLLLIFNPILLHNDINIVDNYIVELEYEMQLDDLELHVNHLNNTINRSERVEGWTCYNYSIIFAENNPDFEVVTVSRSPEFEGISHMTNYQFYNDETVIVYDGLLDKLYFIHDLQWDVEDYNYYYFWIDETPTRECADMVDNRDTVI